MSSRRDYTFEELRERLARRREINRQASKRYRARVRMTREDDGRGVRMTGAPETAPRQDDAPSPPTPPVPSLSKEIEKVGRLLAPLAVRGYEHQPDLWAELAATYPAARLAVEAYKMASWFKDSGQKNRKVRSWPAFLDNWLKKAQQDATAPAPSKPASNGRAPGRPPDPEPVLPAGVTIIPVDLGHYHRSVGDARRVPWKDRVEAAKNGVHR